MRYTGRSIIALTATTMAIGAAPAAAETVYGITGEATPSLVTFDSASPGTFTSDVEITGVDGAIVGMDVRPATLQIVLLDEAGQLYELDPFTGAATAVGEANAAFAGATDIDFNPTVDRIRVVGQAGQGGGAGTGNGRANPNTGGVVGPDGDLRFTDGDTGQVPVVPATAYTNAFPASQTFPDPPATQQFNLESGRDVLVQQVPPNDGTLRTVGPLGVDLDGAAGLDTVTDADGTTNRTYGAFGVAGSAGTGLYSIDTATGAATKLGDFPAARPVRDIAVAPTVPLLAALAEPAGTDAQLLTFFPADRPADAAVNARAVQGLPAGVRLLGIDQRPATGQLYAVGDDSRIYVIDPFTGRARAVGAPFAPTLDFTDEVGFDFNPVPDRIRIVTDRGQNLRVNPDTGAGSGMVPPSALDGPLLGSTSALTAAAYTNSVRPAPTTTALFGLDTARQQLVQVVNPNGGTTEDRGPLNPPGSGVTSIGAANGYDIAPRFNHGFAAADDTLYVVNAAASAGTAANGSAAIVGTFGPGLARDLRGLAVFDRTLLGPAGAPPATPGPAAPAPAPGPGTPAAPGTPPAPGGSAAKVRSRISYSVSPRRDRRAPFQYTVRGRIVPRTSAPLMGAFDGGRVTVRAKRGGTTRTLVARTARVTSSGRFSVRVTVPARGLRQRRGGVVRLNLRFSGTDALFSSRGFARARYR